MLLLYIEAFNYCFLIGTRFVHTSEGKYLVTRLVPCPLCLNSSQNPNSNEAEKPTELLKEIVSSLSSKKSIASTDW